MRKQRRQVHDIPLNPTIDAHFTNICTGVLFYSFKKIIRRLKISKVVHVKRKMPYLSCSVSSIPDPGDKILLLNRIQYMYLHLLSVIHRSLLM